MKETHIEELNEYRFDLPEELIAKYPAIPRDSARLMILKNQTIQHDIFANIDKYLSEKSILVFNNTKVSQRRVFLKRKKTQKTFEVLFLEPIENNLWKCLIRKGSKLSLKEELELGEYTFIIEKKEERFYYVSCWMNQHPAMIDISSAENFFLRYGEPPIPPYLKRRANEIDKIYYQTIFAEKPGSVAAPTASLHFTEHLLNKLYKKHIILFITLHIGYGTFSPLTEKELKTKELHEEPYEIPNEVAQILNENHKKFPIVAVGTTTLRALEDNFRKFQQFQAGKFSTKLFLKPPDLILSTEYLITNFHLPASSLFMLVCAFGGKEFLKQAYDIAIKERYRFYSYGDGMLLQNQIYL